jgi:hypothetical protein
MGDIVKAAFGGIFAVVYESIPSERYATYIADISENTSLSLSDAEHVAQALVREGLVCERHFGYCRRLIHPDVVKYVEGDDKAAVQRKIPAQNALAQ